MVRSFSVIGFSSVHVHAVSCIETLLHGFQDKAQDQEGSQRKITGLDHNHGSRLQRDRARGGICGFFHTSHICDVTEALAMLIMIMISIACHFQFRAMVPEATLLPAI